MSASVPFIWSRLYTAPAAKLCDPLLSDINLTLEHCHASGIVAGRYDTQLSITLVSKFFLKLTGFTYDELMATTGGSLFNLIAPEDRDQFLVASFEDNDSPRELRIITRDNGPLFVQYTKTTSRNAQGDAVWIIAVGSNPARQSLTLMNRAIHTGYWHLDCDEAGRITQVVWDDSLRNILGYKNERDFPNRLESWSRLLHPDDVEKTYAVLNKALTSREAQDRYDIRYRLKVTSGEYRWFHAWADTLRRPDGTPYRMIGFFLNIDAEKELQIQKQAEAFHHAYTRLNLGEFYVNFGTTTFTSLKGAESPLAPLNTRTTWQELVDGYVTGFVVPEDRHRMAEFLDKDHLLGHFDAADTEISEDCRVLLSGEEHWVHNVVMRSDGEDGSPGALVFMRDITTTKKAEEERRKLQEKNSAMNRMLQGFMKLVDRFAFCDLEADHYEFHSRLAPQAYPAQGHYSDLCRWASENFKPVSTDAVYGDLISVENLRKKLTTPESVLQFEYANPDETVFKLASFVPLQWKNGVVTQVLWLVQLITEEKHRQRDSRRALQEAYDAANRANQAKTTFLANMSHDIRTPMNAIVGLTAIAGAHLENTPKVKDCLSQITLSSRHLLGLINEVLDMSRIESGKVALNDEDFNLSELTDNLMLLVRGDMARHRHQFEVTIRGVTHEAVTGDSLRLQQVLTNIVGNAVKYTPDGGQISLTIEEKPTHHRTIGCYEFTIEDNGVGMTPEFLKVLFDPFTRADNHRTTRVPGTGLGMAITKNIVTMMNGSIDVASTPGKGSRFKVTVFLKLQDDHTSDTDRLADLPVLVVDDDPAVCRNTAELLNDIGMKSEWTDTGRAAVDIVTERHRTDDDFFAVIVDWKMPGMSGLETVRNIRRVVGPDVTVIVMSAYDYSDIADEAEAAGVNAFIAKPLFKSKLVSTLCSLVKDDADDAVTPAAQQPDCRGKTILLVEDNDINREVATELISMTGAAVECAVNGRDALDKVSAHPDGYYSLVFMDIQMPVMNGYEAASAIRAAGTPYTLALPIIAMTANAFAEDVILAKKSGMNEHLAKPIDINQLYAVMKRWLSV